MIPNATGSLSSVMNLVPLPGKMTFLPLRETTPIPIPSGPPYVVMFNPETLEETQRYQFNDEQPPGSGGAQQRMNRIPPGDFSFEFLIDGTGASGDKREVLAEIIAFKTIVGMNGDLHRPSFLLLIWGTFIETCVCTDFRVKQTMFRANGTPLRAMVSASFKRHTPPLLDLLLSNFMSADLTHFRLVQEGSTLPLMCHHIYESPRFYPR